MNDSANSLVVGKSPRTPIYVALVALLAVGLPVAAAQLHSTGFLPHSFCYLGNGPLTWTHVISDLIIGISYVAISLTLLLIVRRSERSIPFHWLVLAFGLFIVACGGTHFMDVLTIWKPYYWVSAAVKVVTAAASVCTAIALPLLVPTIQRRIANAKTAEQQREKVEEINRELERLNLELREADQLKDALVAKNAAQIGDWSWDMRSGRNIWSEAVEVMHGMQPGTYNGTYESWWATVFPEDRERVQTAIQRATETGTYEVEYRTIRADGSIYWTAARGKVLLDKHGKPERMLGICMDVTGRKANEEGLLRAEKLAAAGRLAATVAHEINNPLEAVMNLVFLARNAAGDIHPYLEQADRELSRVSAIAKQTLGFYRDTTFPTDVSVEELVDQILETYAGKIQSRRLKIEKSVPHGSVVFIRRGELHQIIANLFSNALDASPVNGRISIKVQPIEEGTLAFELADDGPGIPAEVYHHIFEPFFTTKKDYGTGLGLWVSKRLVEQLGGTISFRTSTNGSGTGTTFRIEIPTAKRELAAATT